MKAVTLGYHDVHDDQPVVADPYRPCAAHYALDLNQFRDHLERIRRSGGQGRVAAISSQWTWGDSIPIFLTFDDGAIGAYTCIAAELEKCGWRGHFFITTDWIGKPGFMNAAQIRELHERGHVIGSHTCSHPHRMSHLGRQELLREWTESRKILAEIIGQDVKVGSVPDGYYAKQVGESAAASGIGILFTSEPKVGAIEVAGTLVLGRYSILRSSPASLAGQLACGPATARWRQSAEWQVKKAAKILAGPYYMRIREAVLQTPRESGSR